MGYSEKSFLSSTPQSDENTISMLRLTSAVSNPIVIISINRRENNKTLAKGFNLQEKQSLLATQPTPITHLLTETTITRNIPFDSQLARERTALQLIAFLPPTRPSTAGTWPATHPSYPIPAIRTRDCSFKIPLSEQSIICAP